MIGSIGKQSGESVESVLKSAIHLSKNWLQLHYENGISFTVSWSAHPFLYSNSNWQPWCRYVVTNWSLNHRMQYFARLIHTHIHTHTHPFNGPLSRTTQVSRYQKGKANLDFTEARDSEWQWHQLGHMEVFAQLQTDNHASTPPLSVLQTRCPSCRPANSVKALKARLIVLR